METITNSSASGVDQAADDRVLVARCLEGDQTGFEGLVERYQQALFTVSLRMLGDYDAANDATQNAFIKAYQSLATFDSNRRFFSWIYRILVNECLNARRDTAKHEPLGPDVTTAGTPADDFESAERRRAVHAAILTLPVEYREVIVLRHFTGLSYEEIGETLGVPTKTVKSRLHMARTRLAVMLGKLDVARKARRTSSRST